MLPKSRVELGKPNVLICIVDDIFPPVISVTWLRNSQPVTEGVTQTSFYTQPNHMFRKFHYLTFVPSAEDVYDCRVEHWGLDAPLLRHWGREHAVPACSRPSIRVCATPDPFLCSLTLAFLPRAPGAYPTTGHRRDPDLWPGPGSRLPGMPPGHRAHYHRHTQAQYPEVQKPRESVGKGRKAWGTDGRGAEGRGTEEGEELEKREYGEVGEQM